MKALAGALLPLLLMVAGACVSSLTCLVPLWSTPWDPWVRLSVVSPGFSSRGVCACVTHPEVQVGRYRERTNPAGL